MLTVKQLKKAINKYLTTTIIAVTLTLAITGTCLYFNSELANFFCITASVMLGIIVGQIVYYREKYEEQAEKQVGIFALIYLGLNTLIWIALFYHYNSQFYKKETRHNVVRKEIISGYQGKSRFILICEDTVIETGMQSYYKINPPQIIYHTEVIR
jgi:uncharacterized membrane protein